MHVIAQYSHKGGNEFIEKNHKKEIKEVKEIIKEVKASEFRTKISKEKTMCGKALYSPSELNNAFKRLFLESGWVSAKIKVKTTVPEIREEHEGIREIDRVKNRLGIEIQFGKYAFMVYNILAKMTIFSKRNIIDSGIEIVPMLALTQEMSTGVSYFELIKTDLEQRGEADLDIPVLILGIDDKEREKYRQLKLA